MIIFIKNSFFYITALTLIVFASCKKEDTEKEAFKRGHLISYQKGGSYSSDALKSLFATYSPELAGEINYEYGVQMYSIEYQTISFDDTETKASGLVVVPTGASSDFPLLSFEHGTVLNKLDVPSYGGSGKDAGLVYATEGYVASLPDFLGLGSGEGFHPYQHAQSEATAVIDMLIATKELCAELGISLNNQLFVTGYSQGGHAAMAALKMLQEEYGEEFSITAGAPLAGPYDMSGVMFDSIFQDKVFAEPAFLPYMLYSYNMIYSFFDDIHSIFVEPYNTLLDDYFYAGSTHNLSEVSAILPESRIPADMLKPEFVEELRNNPQHPARLALEKNDLYDWAPEFPIHLYHCNCDKRVPVTNSQKAYESFKSKGADVELIIPLDSGNHITCIVPAIVQSLNWFNTLKK